MKYFFFFLYLFLCLYESTAHANRQRIHEIIHSTEDASKKNEDKTHVRQKIVPLQSTSKKLSTASPKITSQKVKKSSQYAISNDTLPKQKKENFTQNLLPIKSYKPLMQSTSNPSSLLVKKRKKLPEYKKEETENINGIIYSKNNPNPLTGIVLEYQHSLLFSRIQFIDGIPSGKSQYFYPDGTLQREEIILNGKLHGKRTVFSMHGIKIEEGVYDNGEKNGKFLYYSQNGQIYEEISYIQGRREGIAITYHENKAVKEISQYTNNLIVKEQKEFNEQGTLIRVTPYERGRRQGVEKHYVNNILSKEIVYKEDQAFGKGFIFRENGKDIAISIVYTRDIIFNAFCHPSNNSKKIRISDEEIHLWQQENITPSCP